MKDKYKPEEYWENRLSKKLDITTIGHLGLGYIYNNWLYRARFHAMHRALRKLNLDVSRKSLIDIGVGSGSWIPFWQKHGIAKIVGLDITSASIRALRNQYPQLEFIKRNICAAFPLTKEENFDIVTAFDVLFHIIDDTDFSKAIANISKFVKCGGWVMISDNFCSKSWGPFYHEYHRDYDHYLREFKIVDLNIVHIEPIFTIMTTAICESGTGYKRLLDLFTRVTLRLVSKLSSSRQTEWINYIIGCSLYLLNNILCRIVRMGPSLKILFAQKN